jgi:hypothetical protein
MAKGFREYVSNNIGQIPMGYIVNQFNRVIYIKDDWPEGEWRRPLAKKFKIEIDNHLKLVATYDHNELIIELL